MSIRRCLSGKITESDAFYALPSTAQALYLHLNLQADDDGFLNNAGSIAAQLPDGKAALETLVEKRFVLRFGDIYVIKHWRISNSLKTDRLRPLGYASVARQIWVKPNRAYTDHEIPEGICLFDLRQGVPRRGQIPGFQNGTNWIPKIREDNITKDNLIKPNPREGEKGVWGEIVNLYPEFRIGDLEMAYDAFRKAAQSEEDQRLMRNNLDYWLQSEQWNKEGGQYIPFLENWIQRGVWQGKPGKLVTPTGASGNLGQAELEAIQMVLGRSDERA